MGKEGGARAGLNCHVERSRDISYHHWQQKSGNTGLETRVAQRLSSLCSVPDFRQRAPALLPGLATGLDNSRESAFWARVLIAVPLPAIALDRVNHCFFSRLANS